MDYIQLTCKIDSDDPKLVRDMLVYELNSLGYESYEEFENGIKAYIPALKFNENSLQDIKFFSNLSLGKVTFSHELIKERNWNAEWESNFQPVLIEDKCYVRATFHPALPGVQYEIVIDPKMSFGTGHHETTSLMIEQMLAMNFKGANVLDMGCGTGILSIMAVKLEAKSLTAIDIDEWAYENTIENFSLNNVTTATPILGDNSAIPDRKFSIILANINRNILLADMGDYAKHLSADGKLLLSGIYTHDLPVIEKKAVEYGLSLINTKEKNNWVSSLFRRK